MSEPTEPRNDTGIHPIRAHILVRIIPERKSEGGIDLPEGVRLKNRAIVVGVGGGHVTDGGAIVPLAVRPGDFIIAHIPAGIPVVERDPDRGDLVIIGESMVAAIDRRPPSVAHEVVPASRILQ